MQPLVASLLLLAQATIGDYPDTVNKPHFHQVTTTDNKLASAAHSGDVLLLVQLDHERLQGRHRKQVLLTESNRTVGLVAAGRKAKTVVHALVAERRRSVADGAAASEEVTLREQGEADKNETVAIKESKKTASREEEAVAKKTPEEGEEEDTPDDVKEEEDSEEEEEESFVAVAIAAALLASISFIMMLSYLVNHRDGDIRHASYRVISTTISIFCAVLVNQAVNDVLSFFCPAAPVWQVSLSVLQVFFWHCLTELTLGYCTGIFGARRAGSSHGEVRCQTKCYAVLLAHITGFAAIYATGEIQQHFFSKTPLISAIAVILAFVFLRVLQEISEKLRHWYFQSIEVKPDLESIHLWEEETEEAENDVICFAVSFTLIQTVRFGIGGVLPNEDGEEPPSIYLHHPHEQPWLLLVLGVVFISLTLLAYYRMRTMGRFTLEFVTSMAMCFAWCTFYGTQWLVGATRPLAFEHDYVLLSVFTSMICSSVAFGMIFFINFLTKIHHGDEDELDELDDALRKLYRVMGLLVGFAWEETFDDAEEALETIMDYPQAGKLVMAVLTLILLIPAWRWYVLPMVHQGGWKFGFVAEHLIERVQQYDAEVAVEVEQSMVKLNTEHLNVEKEKTFKRRQRMKARRAGGSSFNLDEDSFSPRSSFGHVTFGHVKTSPD